MRPLSERATFRVHLSRNSFYSRFNAAGYYSGENDTFMQNIHSAKNV